MRITYSVLRDFLNTLALLGFVVLAVVSPSPIFGAQQQQRPPATKQPPAETKQAPAAIPSTVLDVVRERVETLSEGAHLAYIEPKSIRLIRYLNGKYVLTRTISGKDVAGDVSGLEIAPGLWLGKGTVTWKPYCAKWNIDDGFTVETFEKTHTLK
jgi:hypothetical protein